MSVIADGHVVTFTGQEFDIQLDSPVVYLDEEALEHLRAFPMPCAYDEGKIAYFSFSKDRLVYEEENRTIIWVLEKDRILDLRTGRYCRKAVWKD